MSRTPNTHGGGARTNKNGLHFEQTTSLDNALCNAGYKVTNYEVYRGSQKIGMSVLRKNYIPIFLIHMASSTLTIIPKNGDQTKPLLISKTTPSIS